MYPHVWVAIFFLESILLPSYTPAKSITRVEDFFIYVKIKIFLPFIFTQFAFCMGDSELQNGDPTHAWLYFNLDYFNFDIFEKLH